MSLRKVPCSCGRNVLPTGPWSTACLWGVGGFGRGLLHLSETTNHPTHPAILHFRRSRAGERRMGRNGCLHRSLGAPQESFPQTCAHTMCSDLGGSLWIETRRLAPTLPWSDQATLDANAPAIACKQAGGSVYQDVFLLHFGFLSRIIR